MLAGGGGSRIRKRQGSPEVSLEGKGREQQRQVRERDMQEGGGPPSDWDANGRTVQLGEGGGDLESRRCATGSEQRQFLRDPHLRTAPFHSLAVLAATVLFELFPAKMKLQQKGRDTKMYATAKNQRGEWRS